MNRVRKLRAPSVAIAAAAALYAAPASALEINLVHISTPFQNPIGIDYFEPQNKVVMSAFYPSGNPYNFELVAQDGTHQQFSTISGLTDEIKIATARSAARGGYAGSPFAAGTMFTGNGDDGEIVRINPDGTLFAGPDPHANPWVSLPGAGNGLMRGSLYVDRTGVFNGDLIAATTNGQVWRVDGTGAASLVANVGAGIHLEGMITVPNDVAKYGQLAGKIIAGNENNSRLYAISAAGAVQQWTLGFQIEDIDLINGNENFFGVNFGTGRLLGADASQFAANIGDILITSEVQFSGAGQAGMALLKWDAVNNIPVFEVVTLAAGSVDPGQWEHVTFAPAGVREVPPTPDVPEPGVLGLLGLGLAGLGVLRRRRVP